LLDGVASLSASAQDTNSQIPIIRVISGGTLVDALLSEFPDLICPMGIQREVRYNTVHHIRTTPGRPVTRRPRRLELDQLAITKAEFDAKLRDD
jgi:hypothetical protein